MKIMGTVMLFDLVPLFKVERYPAQSEYDIRIRIRKWIRWACTIHWNMPGE